MRSTSITTAWMCVGLIALGACGDGGSERANVSSAGEFDRAGGASDPSQVATDPYATAQDPTIGAVDAPSACGASLPVTRISDVYGPLFGPLCKAVAQCAPQIAERPPGVGEVLQSDGDDDIEDAFVGPIPQHCDSLIEQAIASAGDLEERYGNLPSALMIPCVIADVVLPVLKQHPECDATVLVPNAVCVSDIARCGLDLADIACSSETQLDMPASCRVLSALGFDDDDESIPGPPPPGGQGGQGGQGGSTGQPSQQCLNCVSQCQDDACINACFETGLCP